MSLQIDDIEKELLKRSVELLDRINKICNDIEELSKEIQIFREVRKDEQSKDN